jgi:hypothetical protein
MDPCEHTELPKIIVRRTRTLTPDEFGRFIAAIPERQRLLVVTASETGTRWCELVALRPRHIDFLRSTVTVEETIVEGSKKHSGTGERMIIKPYPKTTSRAPLVCGLRGWTRSLSTSGSMRSRFSSGAGSGLAVAWPWRTIHHRHGQSTDDDWMQALPRVSGALGRQVGLAERCRIVCASPLDCVAIKPAVGVNTYALRVARGKSTGGSACLGGVSRGVTESVSDRSLGCSVGCSDSQLGKTADWLSRAGFERASTPMTADVTLRWLWRGARVVSARCLLMVPDGGR